MVPDDDHSGPVSDRSDESDRRAVHSDDADVADDAEATDDTDVVDDADASDDSVARQTRRRVLQAAAAAGTFTAFGLPASAQDGEQIELGGEVNGWEGRAPSDIEGETNPTLELEAGTTYEIVWENVDGLPHNVIIEDDGGEELVASELVSESGATQTVEFEATEAMAEYYCEVHPQSMRGDIEIAGGAAGAQEEQPEEDEEAEETEEEPEAEQEEEEAEEPEADGFFQAGAEVGVRTIAEGLTAPTDVAVDDAGRAFVTDQTGEVWFVESAGADFAIFDDADGGDLAMDISDRLVAVGQEFEGPYADPDQDYDERGLLGIALHPDFLENGRFFLHYSAPPNRWTPEGWSHVEVISEFQVTEDGQSLDPDSEQVLMEIQSPQYNHDGGPIAFGPDGYLYVPMGDGGGANDSMEGHVDDWYDENDGGNGQDTTENALGGIHRIDVDSQETIRGQERPYGVPDDNPLVGVEGHIDEYYAWGFRNPFGITFDSEGQMIVADAGQDLYEEASVVESGGNYGWNVQEGTHCFSTESPGEPPGDCPDETPEDVRGGEPLIDPVVEYPHEYEGSSVGIVISGGHVYEAGEIEDLQGKYVFGDWTRDVAREEPDGRVFAAQPEEGGAEMQVDPSDESVPTDELWEMEELVFAGSEDGNLNRFVRQFGQGPNGEVLLLVNARGVPVGETGEVLQLVPPGDGEELQVPDLPQEVEEITEEKEPAEDEENATDTTDGTGDADNETAVENETEVEDPTGGENQTDAEGETDAGNETEGGEETDAGNETEGGGETDAGNETGTGNETDDESA